MEEKKTEIIFKGGLKLEDMHKSNRYQLRIRRKRSLIYIGIMVGIMFYILYNAIDNISNSTSQGIFLSTIGIIFLGLVLGIIVGRTLIKKRTESLYNLNPTLSNKTKYIANDIGLKLEMINELERFYEWKNILKAYEFSDMFLIYINSQALLFIPKSFFETQEDADYFSNLLSCKTKKTML
ncbi:YcxB family protein [Desemzia sp. C1]|uniref:YcxB family protein n=1 Tax=Desemzia sp. C1 TaxID=2892016 RepID=UPI001E432949|nr:YcxB family protein [Desemzia sp. C1]MCI3028852.1 YcxB family protein [Desemzia sp. C1]